MTLFPTFIANPAAHALPYLQEVYTRVLPHNADLSIPDELLPHTSDLLQIVVLTTHIVTDEPTEVIVSLLRVALRHRDCLAFAANISQFLPTIAADIASYRRTAANHPLSPSALEFANAPLLVPVS
jgi:hypothetical protein